MKVVNNLPFLFSISTSVNIIYHYSVASGTLTINWPKVSSALLPCSENEAIDPRDPVVKLSAEIVIFMQYLSKIRYQFISTEHM